MINPKFFFQGFKSLTSFNSPAIALGASFLAIGALLKSIGFNIQLFFIPNQNHIIQS